ncbi:3-hexulose-6-phosphate synthase [Clostridium saccharoperbutylacetonicum]|uniref:3-hexulose-6-phosphate synthase n=1 Tax=Clostridium saccharoperbutylacetonicum N1-4(HMT) TaxID=931276 RepID=M1MLC6_9CLOT|nr:orotidine 5'-phosphate decarboxylase / HUMPS family protein [Clostridium saccharoperbutylacetonicum]AGF58714.1 3-hexulose-6-phosphate synthase [Clostridium saccharoperbutylacetonicum N1-4(HMT)]NRT60507.1 3-hexulose-6-phosphate synthase [Clostridium saccharoperbutylacetonicum]NSB23821.1 3-hexulose-6-phosphate synthase [Clostridium saccharoperbutylacetonicum]NSB43197.1 3-hexulose-6-phosphate synthase [Clostridium saccharoperbutylacetonicum]
MKLQVAIDRVSFEKAKNLTEIFDGLAEVIEIGTSLIKDYGLLKLKELTSKKNTSKLLGDIKTSDEGAYEFKQGFKQGFDILTVMGSAALETIDKCYEASEQNNGTMMIDLLECSDEKIKEISHFKNAIYCIHASIDREKLLNPAKTVKEFKERFPQVNRIAVAGGITLDCIPELSKHNIELVIVGSAITDAENPVQKAKQFKEAMGK